jgi:hypothetical protein
MWIDLRWTQDGKKPEPMFWFRHSGWLVCPDKN